MEYQKWSRDWSKFDWDLVKERLDVVELLGQVGNISELDIGINKVEFLEYMDWLYENVPNCFWMSLFIMSLSEMGVNEEDIELVMNNPDALEEVFIKIKELSSVSQLI